MRIYFSEKINTLSGLLVSKEAEEVSLQTSVLTSYSILPPTVCQPPARGRLSTPCCSSPRTTTPMGSPPGRRSMRL